MDSNDIIYLSKAHFSNENYSFINEFLKEKELINSVQKFESTLESFIKNNKKLACLSSGTSAIHLALIIVGVQKGDDVICQSLTFVATVNPILYVGANPIFVDSETETWNMCPIQLEKVIQHKISQGKKPKAILMVHIFGMPAKMNEIGAIAKKYEIILIEDAAEALGSSYKDNKCGSFGDYAIFSFNQNKIITTSGGGALICNSDLEKRKAVFLATQSKDDYEHYEHSQVGYNYRMGELNAALGIIQLKDLNEKISLRRANNKFYQKLFEKIEGVKVFKEPNENFYSNHWLSCIQIDKRVAGFSKKELRLWLKDKDIESRSVWKPMHLQPVFKGFEYFGEMVSEELFLNGLCLPSSSNLTELEKERIRCVVNQFIENRS